MIPPVIVHITKNDFSGRQAASPVPTAFMVNGRPGACGSGLAARLPAGTPGDAHVAADNQNHLSMPDPSSCVTAKTTQRCFQARERHEGPAPCAACERSRMLLAA